MDKLTLFLLILFLGACTSKQHAPIAEGRKASSFFDLEIYFQQEAVRLNAQSYHLKKQLKIDSVQEEQILETVNFEEELAAFSRLKRLADASSPCQSMLLVLHQILLHQSLAILNRVDFNLFWLLVNIGTR